MSTLEKLEELGATVDVCNETSTVSVRFDDLLDYAKVELGESHARDKWAFGREYDTLAEARRAVAIGACPERIWAHYLRFMDELQGAIEDAVQRGKTVRRRRVRREEGSELDIDRVMTFDPQCWESRVRGKQKTVVTVAIQAMFPAFFGDKSIAQVAAKGVALADVAERLGYGVRVVAVTTGLLYNGRFGRRIIQEVTLKRADQPLDPRSLLTVGIPAFARVMGFGVNDLAAGHEHWNAPLWTPKADKLAELGWDVYVGQKMEWSPRGAYGEDEALTGFVKALDGGQVQLDRSLRR